MTLGDLIECLCAAYERWPWDVRSVLVARVVDIVTLEGWGPEC